jgi:hypothetical protein
MSKKLTAAEQNYSTTERELLAIVHCIKTSRRYLAGAIFKVVTDHAPLLALVKGASEHNTARLV